MKTSLPWIKLHTDLLHSTRLSRLPDMAKLRYLQLMMLAGECNAAGCLVIDDEPMNSEDLTWRLHIDAQQLAADLELLAAAGLLDRLGEAWLSAKPTTRQASPRARDARPKTSAAHGARRNSASASAASPPRMKSRKIFLMIQMQVQKCPRICPRGQQMDMSALSCP